MTIFPFSSISFDRAQFTTGLRWGLFLFELQRRSKDSNGNGEMVLREPGTTTSD